jgi:hypothetical protein
MMHGRPQGGPLVVKREFSVDFVADSEYGKKYEELSPEEKEKVDTRFALLKSRWDGIYEEADERLRTYEESIRPTFDEARSLSDSEIKIQSNQYQEALKNLDDQREWLAGVVHSPEYARRLRVNERINDLEEIDGSYYDVYEEDVTGKSKNEVLQDILARRKKRVIQDALRISDTVQYPIAEGELGGWNHKDEIDVPEQFRDLGIVDKDDAVLPESTTGVHELEHHVTEGEMGISPAAKWLYGRAFNSDYINQTYPEYAEYLSRPEEIDAFKREFEYNLEQITDWKYGEPFTPQLIEQIKKLRDEGKFNNGSQIFLDIIKPGYLMRVMNTLAQNESNQIIQGQSERQNA